MFSQAFHDIFYVELSVSHVESLYDGVMEFGFKGKSSLQKLFDLLVFFPLDQNGAASLTQCFVLTAIFQILLRTLYMCSMYF